MVIRAFCELFTAGCLEVREARTGAAGGPRRLYRAAPDLDLSLLTEVERVVARCLEGLTSFPELVRRAEAAARRDGLDQAEGLHEDVRVVIDEAREFFLPTSSCSI